MTVIIGYVDKKSKQTYMGCDRCASNSIQKFTISQSKIYQPAENPNFLIGFAGDPRVKQLITNNLQFPTEKQLEADSLEVNERYIVNYVIPTMQKALIDNQYHDFNLEASQILLSYKNNLWTIGYGYQLISVEGDYMTVGSGTYTANGVLEALKDSDMNSIDKIIKALKISSKLANGVEGPYDLYLSGKGKLSDESLEAIINDVSVPEVIRTVNNKYIKKVLNKECTVDFLVSSLEKNEQISYMTRDNKDVYFLDFNGILGILRSNGDVVYNSNELDELAMPIWSIVEVTPKAVSTIKSINKFNFDGFEDEECDMENIDIDTDSLTPEEMDSLKGALEKVVNAKN